MNPTGTLARVAAALLTAAAPGSPIAQTPDLTGTWVGSGTLTNNWSDPTDPKIALRCVYVGKAQPPSITIRVPPAGGPADLTLAFTSSNASCPDLRRRYQVGSVEIAGTRLVFSDPAGHRWELKFTDDLLSGEVTWNRSAPNPNEALAVGFTYAAPLRPWDIPLTRLSGKITLSRQAR